MQLAVNDTRISVSSFLFILYFFLLCARCESAGAATSFLFLQENQSAAHNNNKKGVGVPDARAH